jgi:environmental stress-induced protein Ves
VIVRSSELVEVPWRNGAGVTRQILAQDGWRVSIAELAGPAPFSTFAGLNRIFTVISADPVELSIIGSSQIADPLVPISFSGDAAVFGRPMNGAAQALNVMADAATSVDVVRVDGGLSISAGLVELIVVLSGSIQFGCDALPALDTLRLPPGDVILAGAAIIAHIKIQPSYQSARA